VHGVGAWDAWPFLSAALRDTGGALGSCDHPAVAVSSQRALGPRGLAAGLAFTAGALAEYVREYTRGLASRRAVRTNRAQHTEQPRAWFSLLPTWYRMNRVMIETVLHPLIAREREHGRSGSQPSFGALLIGELARGERNEQKLTSITGRTLWAGLRDLREPIAARPVEQIVCTESLPALATDLLVAAGRAVRVIARCAVHPARLELAGYTLDLRANALALARVASIDVCRATFSERATRAFLERMERKGERCNPVVFATTASTAPSTASTVLQSRGVQVIEVLHGTAGEGWPGLNENNASVVVVPTRADQRALAPLPARAVVGGMPMPRVIAPRPSGERVRNVLVMSTFLHRDWVGIGGHFLVPLQHELLRTAAMLRAALGERVRIRWRPHPADMTDLVREAHARVPDVDLSHGVRGLADDLEWSDLVVSSPSSAIFEALFAGVPVFVYAEPDQWSTPVADWCDPARVFFWAEPGVQVLTRTLAALERGEPDVLAPEQHAREQLFGPTGAPVPTLEVLRTLFDEAPPAHTHASPFVKAEG
jgi:hypothetical protein